MVELQLSTVWHIKRFTKNATGRFASEEITGLRCREYPDLTWEARLYLSSPKERECAKGFAGFWLCANLADSSAPTRSVWAHYRATLLDRNGREISAIDLEFRQEFVPTKRWENLRGRGLADAFKIEDVTRAIFSSYGSVYIRIDFTILTNFRDCIDWTNAPFQSQSRKHLQISCSDCRMNPIVGYRFKGLICANYDLCSVCQAEKHSHDRHPMIRISDPLDGNWRAKFVRASPSIVESQLRRQIALLEENRDGLNEFVCEQHEKLQALELAQVQRNPPLCPVDGRPAFYHVCPSECVIKLLRENEEHRTDLARLQACSLCFHEFSETNYQETLYPCGHSTFCCECIATILVGARTAAINAANQSALFEGRPPPNPDDIRYFGRCPTCKREFGDKLRIYVG